MVETETCNTSAGLSRKFDHDLQGIFMLAGPPSTVKAASSIVGLALGGKGGGRPGRLQGKASQLQNASSGLLESLRQVDGNAGMSATTNTSAAR